MAKEIYIVILLLFVVIYLVFQNSKNKCDLGPAIEEIRKKDLTVDLSTIENKLNESENCVKETIWKNVGGCSIENKQKQIGENYIIEPAKNGGECELGIEEREIECDPLLEFLE